MAYEIPTRKPNGELTDYGKSLERNYNTQLEASQAMSTYKPPKEIEYVNGAYKNWEDYIYQAGGLGNSNFLSRDQHAQMLNERMQQQENDRREREERYNNYETPQYTPPQTPQMNQPQVNYPTTAPPAVQQPAQQQPVAPPTPKPATDFANKAWQSTQSAGVKDYVNQVRGREDDYKILEIYKYQLDNGAISLDQIPEPYRSIFMQFNQNRG